MSDKEKLKKAPSNWSRRFVSYCDNAAGEMAKGLCSELDDVPPDQRESFIAFCLSDELVHFFYHAFTFHMKDPDGSKWLEKISAVRRGRASGDKRQHASLKLKFLKWALAENARNPGLSKNAVADRYAKENPGCSPATLRRYLAQIPNRGDD